MASSASGKKEEADEEGKTMVEPLDVQVTMNMTLNQFPNSTHCKKDIKFATNKDKFLQFAKDIKDALELMESVNGK